MKAISLALSGLIFGFVLQTCEARACSLKYDSYPNDICKCKSCVVKPQKMPKVVPKLCKRKSLLLCDCCPATCTTSPPEQPQCGACSCPNYGPPAPVNECCPPRQDSCLSVPDYQPFPLNTDYCRKYQCQQGSGRQPVCGCDFTPPPPPPEVDPVSLALALNRPCCNTKEDKLSFGACRLPVEGAIENPTYYDVQEGGLYALKDQVMELRAPPCCQRKSLAEEALECYCDEEDENLICDNGYKPSLTYRDLGYVPEQPKCAPFTCRRPPPPVEECPPTKKVVCKPRAGSCCYC